MPVTNDITDTRLCVRQVSPLRAARRARELPLRVVAAQAKIDFGHLSRIERGHAQPSVDTLYRLATVVGLTELAEMIAPYVHARRAS